MLGDKEQKQLIDSIGKKYDLKYYAIKRRLDDCCYALALYVTRVIKVDSEKVNSDYFRELVSDVENAKKDLDIYTGRITE